MKMVSNELSLGKTALQHFKLLCMIVVIQNKFANCLILLSLNQESPHNYLKEQNMRLNFQVR